MPVRLLLLFLGVTFAWSWGFWALPVLLHQGVALPQAIDEFAARGTPAAWGPLVGAMVVALVRGGPAGITALLRRGIAFGFGWRWWAVVLLTFPLLVGGALFLARLTGVGFAPTEPMLNPVMIPVGFVVILFTGGPLQEEFGWRGTLLDPLQARFGALWASLAVGAIWAVWHLPLFYFPNDVAPYYDRPFWGLLVTSMMISVLFTWVWNNTAGSVAAVMILHTMFNLSHWVFPVLQSDAAALALFGLQFAAVAAVVVLFGPRRLRRAPG
jgi:hypothetical protein